VIAVWYTLFKYGVFVPGVRLLLRPWVEGEENIPAEGGAILASNHLGAAEAIMLPASIRRRMTYPAKAELFRRGFPGSVLGWFLKSVGQVPLERGGGRQSAEGLRPVIEVLHKGELVGIFPEGTRSVDGRLYKGKTGVARMALAAGVPVIPVGMIGTQGVRGRLGLPTVENPGIVIGKPMDFTAYAGQADDLKVLRWITDEIMAAIQRLTGQVYVDVYGGRVKHGNLVGADVRDRIQPRPGGGPAPAVMPRVAADADTPEGRPSGGQKDTGSD